MNEENLKELHKIFGVIDVPSTRNYWLIRTSAGSYFNDFYNNGYVAIGWDKFSNVSQMKHEKEDCVKSKIADEYKDEKRPGYIYNQIKRFMFEIKEDDLVLIPSENSADIAFGIVTKSMYIRDNVLPNSSTTKSICTYKKCIGVKWIKIISKDNFDPYLRMLMFAHSTVSSVNDYKDYINRLLFPIYVSSNQIHLTYKVQTTNDISFTSFSGFLNVISNSLKLFDEITDNNYQNSKLDIKTTVNSPGVIEFIGYCFGAGLALTCINAFLFGGKSEIDILKAGKYTSEHSGLLGTILKFKQEANKKETEFKKLENDYLIQKQTLNLQAPNEPSNKE